MKITQAGIDRRAAAHNTDWIKERGQPAICPGRDEGVVHQLAADPMESRNPAIKGWRSIALLAFKCAISCLLLISLICIHVRLCIYIRVCVIHIYTIFLLKILTLLSHSRTLSRSSRKIQESDTVSDLICRTLGWSIYFSESQFPHR